MATMNPLEKKARTSFIKGMLIAALIGILVAILLGYKIYKMNADEKARIAALRPVVVLNTDVKSGDEITPDMLVSTTANAEVANSGSLTMSQYNTSRDIIDENGNLVGTNKIIAKIDIPAKAILTPEMLTAEENITTNDLREVEYNMLVLPSKLENGETIDIRLRLPSGADYIVLSKKRVTLADLGGVTSDTTILLNVAEEQILTMDAAIVDAYRMKGSKLYAVKYTEPGLQSAAIPTYVPSNDTVSLIDRDPNIVTTARNELISRYNQSYNSYRPGIDNAINQTDEEERKSNVESGTSSEITKQQTERKQYIDAIYGGIE